MKPVGPITAFFLPTSYRSGFSLTKAHPEHLRRSRLHKALSGQTRKQNRSASTSVPLELALRTRSFELYQAFQDRVSHVQSRHVIWRFPGQRWVKVILTLLEITSAG